MQFSHSTVVGVIPQHCGPQRPEERLSCPSLVVRSPCIERLTAVFAVSPGPTLSPVLLHIQTSTDRNMNTVMQKAKTHTRLQPALEYYYLSYKNSGGCLCSYPPLQKTTHGTWDFNFRQTEFIKKPPLSKQGIIQRRQFLHQLREINPKQLVCCVFIYSACVCSLLLSL